MEKAHCLVIDDDECIRIFLAAVFQNETGVKTACGGREALNLLDQHQYDVIISDAWIPYLIGLDFFRRFEQYLLKSQVSLYSVPET